MEGRVNLIAVPDTNTTRAGLRGGPEGPWATHQKELKGATHQISQIYLVNLRELH